MPLYVVRASESPRDVEFAASANPFAYGNRSSVHCAGSSSGW